MSKKKIAVIVGRFQNYKLHDGHKSLIQYASDNYDKIIIALGTSRKKSCKTDPLSVATRIRIIKRDMSLAAYQKTTFIKLSDKKSDVDWSNTLDTLCSLYDVEEVGIDLIVGRDSFKSHYSGKHINNFVEVPEVVSENATKYRENINDIAHIAHQKSFAQGVIWSTQQQYPKVHATVDVAVIRKLDDKTLILLGRKHEEQGWRLPGGFSDPTDESYAHAAVRELKEETNIVVGHKRLEYVNSIRLDDWRYRTGEDKVITSLFVCPFNNTGTGAMADSYILKDAKAGDDLAELKWVELSKDLGTDKFTSNSLLPSKLEPEHKKLFDVLISDYLNK